MANKPHVDGKKIARLMYILNTNRNLVIPPKIVRLIPGGEWINAMSEKGPGGSGVDLNLIETLITEGAKLGEGDVTEGITIIQQLVDQALREDQRLSMDQRIAVYRILDGLKDNGDNMTEIIDLSDPGEITEIPKFDLGFLPFDTLLGGFYQGIFMILAPPGTGKTSLLISMMEALRANGHEGPLMMVENEIPVNMMKGRVAPVLRRTPFDKGDEIICGAWNATTILEYIKENPDPERVLLFDSPDVMIGQGSSDGKRFYLENEYLTLVEIKRHCKAVIVSSWPNRKNEAVQHQYDVSEAVAKSWYSDAIIGMNIVGTSLELKSLKNRFGPSNQQLAFAYDYAEMTWDDGSIVQEMDFWNEYGE